MENPSPKQPSVASQLSQVIARMARVHYPNRSISVQYSGVSDTLEFSAPISLDTMPSGRSRSLLETLLLLQKTIPGIKEGYSPSNILRLQEYETFELNRFDNGVLSLSFTATKVERNGEEEAFRSLASFAAALESGGLVIQQDDQSKYGQFIPFEALGTKVDPSVPEEDLAIAMKEGHSLLVATNPKHIGVV